mmetsp:Transcript_9835/g.39882  ORF Transcript_9835/g.39882 Transcript_9835/m.39882 type:complete len:785 (+) Transcript_9835:158-2512(+)
MVSFKVKLPAEYMGEQVQEFSFGADVTVADAVNKVAAETKLTSPDLYTFYIPSADAPEGTWLNPKDQLSAYPVASAAVVHVRRSHCLMSVVCFSTEFWRKNVLFSLSAPLGEEWIPYLHYKFGIDMATKLELAFIVDKKQGPSLDPSKALKDQDFPTSLRSTQLLLFEAGTTVDKTGLKIFLDIQEKQQQRGTKGKPVDDVVVDPLAGGLDLEAPAGTLLINFPILNGYLSMMTKKKKWERWFCILIDNHLFYYRSQNDAKPSQVVPLIDYTAAKVDDKKKKIQYGVELSIPEKKISIMNKADDSRWQTLWYDAIVKCIEQAKVDLEAKKNEKKSSSGKVFEAPLADQVTVQDGSELPVVVEKCMEYIEERALAVEGIFRLSGSAVLIKEYKDRFDSGENVSFENESDPHAVAGLLKLYFRELPEPIMTYDHYDNFIIGEGIPNPTLRLRYLRYLMETYLAPLNRALLKRLVSFLRKVNEHSEVNKMPIHNIATVFGPNLLKQRNANMLQMVEDTAQINNIVNIFINHDGYLFNDRPLPEESEEDQLLGTFAKAQFDYQGDTEEDLNFKKNDVIAVIAQGVDGWWKGEKDGKFGKFPGSYVQLLSAAAYQKNLRRVRFEKEMVKLNAQKADEEKTIEKLEKELEEMEPVAARVREKYEEVKAIVQEAGSVLTCSESYPAFKAKNKELGEHFASYTTFHDDIVDSRYEILQANKEVNERTAPSKDKKKKADKKQEKVNEAVRKAVAGLDLRFGQEQHLHSSILEFEGAVIQGLQSMDLLAQFADK